MERSNKSLGEDPCDPAREERILPPPFINLSYLSSLFF